MHPLAHIQNTGMMKDNHISAYFAIVVHQAVRSWVRSNVMGCTVYHSKGIPTLVQDVLDNIPSTTIAFNTTRQMYMMHGKVEYVDYYLEHRLPMQ
eukprot:4769927-Amphidinium_carterae.1